MRFSTPRYPLFRAIPNFYGNSVSQAPDPLSEDSINNNMVWCLRRINFSRLRQLQLHLASHSSTVNHSQGNSLSPERCSRGWLYPSHRAKAQCESLVAMNISSSRTVGLSSRSPERRHRWSPVRTQLFSSGGFHSLTIPI
jgi:hypothetical protein